MNHTTHSTQVAWDAYQVLDDTFVRMRGVATWSRFGEWLEWCERLIEAKRRYVTAAEYASMDPARPDLLEQAFQSMQ